VSVCVCVCVCVCVADMYYVQPVIPQGETPGREFTIAYYSRDTRRGVDWNYKDAEGKVSHLHIYIEREYVCVYIHIYIYMYRGVDWNL
jgi:hypothetical protein